MSTISEHVAVALARHVRNVFGVMGNGNAWLLDAIERKTDARYAAVRHEAGAVAAADAHFRASGTLAAATATYGAGYTNTITPLAESAQARIPVLVVVGDEPTTGRRPWDVDQVAIAAALGIRTFTVDTAAPAATTIDAIEYALSEQTPVILAIPYDLVRADAGPIPQTRAVQLPQRRTLDDLADLDRIADLIAAAERPALIAGRGAWLSRAGNALGALADATGAVTATTSLSRGLFPRGEYDLGVTGGFGAHGAMSAIRDADVAVVFGASLNQFTMRFGELFGPGARVIQVDTEAQATHPRVDDFIRADAAWAAMQLTERIRVSRADPGWRSSLDIDALRAYDESAEFAADGRLDPRALARRVGELLPEDRVVVSDGGHFIGWANMYWPVAAPDRMLMVGTRYQTIGLGIHTVAGAALARPDSTVVLTVGDGGALMALSDLETAIRVARGRGLAVVWNDGAYGAEVNLYGILGAAEAPMLIPQVDFAAVAAAMGAESVVVERWDDLAPLAEWAQEPADSRPFLLLDLRISTSVIAPYQEEIIRVNS